MKVTINDYIELFKISYKKHYGKDIIIKPKNYKYFHKHIEICDKLLIQPAVFYNMINNYLSKNNINPLISSYSEFRILSLIKQESKNTKNISVDNIVSIEKQNKIKKKLEALWSSDNIFKTHSFLYKIFTKEYLLQDKQFMELRNKKYDFQGFDIDIAEYIM